MPSTFSDNLALELQADGENNNTWGQLLNAVLELLDKAVTEQLSLDCSGSSDITLSAAQYQNFRHEYSGTLTGNINVVVPATNRLYLLENATSGAFSLTVKTPAGSGVAIPQGKKIFVYCDGTDVIAAIDLLRDVVDDTTPQLGGFLDTNGNAIEFSEGAAVASAAQPDIFGGQDGNTLHITGTTQIDDFVDAPRIGASRWLVFDGALTVTHGSGITILGGQSLSMAAGDVAYVYADAVDAFVFIHFPIAGVVKLSLEQQWTKPQYASITAITPDAAINVDMAQSNNFEITDQDQNFTLNFTNIQKGQGGQIFIDFDGGGPYTLTPGTGVKTINGGEGITFGGSGGTANLLSYYAYATDAVALVVATDLQ
jgi:hypothetical protein